jgi:hypothetical protein
MSDVACVNEECAEYGIAKANPMDYPVAEIICGTCNGSVEEVASGDTDS